MDIFEMLEICNKYCVQGEMDTSIIVASVNASTRESDMAPLTELYKTLLVSREPETVNNVICGGPHEKSND